MRVFLALATLTLAAACGDSDPGGPSVLLSAEANDPAGDGGVADLIFASLEVVDAEIRVRAELTAGTFHGDSMLVTFNLDTDEQSGTGYTTANPGHAGIGIDCLIELGKTSLTTLGARVRQFENGSFVTTLSVDVTTVGQGYEATVPLSACDDDGRAVLRIDAFRQLSDIGYSIRQDWLPDAGTAPLLVR